MTALTSPLRRDDFARCSVSPPVEAEIIPFRRPQPARQTGSWRSFHGSVSALPRIVPVSLIRQIDRELQTHHYDPAILAGSCRGLKRGSSLFEEIYIAARVRDFTREAWNPLDSNPVNQPVIVTTLHAYRTVAGNSVSSPFHPPRAILHGGHLMHHFGVWIVALLTVQLMSASLIGSLAHQILGGGGLFHAATWLCLMLAFNLRVWFRHYGHAAEDFHIPGAFLFLAAVLPVILLHFLADFR